MLSDARLLRGAFCILGALALGGCSAGPGQVCNGYSMLETKPCPNGYVCGAETGSGGSGDQFHCVKLCASSSECGKACTCRPGDSTRDGGLPPYLQSAGAAVGICIVPDFHTWVLNSEDYACD
jgi:hypothetical protein